MDKVDDASPELSPDVNTDVSLDGKVGSDEVLTMEKILPLLTIHDSKSIVCWSSKQDVILYELTGPFDNRVKTFCVSIINANPPICFHVQDHCIYIYQKTEEELQSSHCPADIVVMCGDRVFIAGMTTYLEGPCNKKRLQFMPRVDDTKLSK